MYQIYRILIIFLVCLGIYHICDNTKTIRNKYINYLLITLIVLLSLVLCFFNVALNVYLNKLLFIAIITLTYKLVMDKLNTR